MEDYDHLRPQWARYLKKKKIDIAVNAHKRHPSIKLIIRRVTVSEKFSFQHVFKEEILSKLKNLDPTKPPLLAVYL